MNTPDNEMWVDSTLDKFSKAHPFADIKAYNLFHAEAKAQIIAKLREARTAGKPLISHYSLSENETMA